MKCRLLLCMKMIMFFLFFRLTVNAQNANGQNISGQVIDSSNQPIAGVEVRAVGSSLHELTDIDGRFNLSITSRTRMLEFSLIGFVTQKIAIANQNNFKIKLLPIKSNLNEVVVIGAQTQTRKQMTAAVSSISGDVINNLPSTSVDGLLQGRIPGLNVQISSGEPGVAPTLVVRGNSKMSTQIGSGGDVTQAQSLSAPLYVIDGVPMDPSDIAGGSSVTGTNYLAGINVNDIESVDVQKDAAATAAWGSRGANGVIYIKTRKGISKFPSFVINSYFGITQKPQLAKTYTGAEEREMKMDIIRNYATPAQLRGLPIMLTDSLNPSYNNATDWQGLFYKDGWLQNTDITMSQSTENINYRVNGNFYNETGIIKQFGYKRYSIRGNFNFKISSKLNSQFIFGASRGDRKRGRKFNNSDPNTPFEGTSQPSSFYPINAYDSANLIGQLDLIRNSNIDENYNASWITNYNILPWIRLSVMGAATSTNSNRDYFRPSTLLDDDGASQPSYALSQKSGVKTYYVRNNLDINRQYGRENHKHSFNLTLGQEFNSTIYDLTSVSGYNVPSNSIHVVTGIPQTDRSGSSDYQKASLVSFTGQLQYDYNKKYLVYVSMRRDGASRFGANNKWGGFPAFGLGYNLIDEPFMDKFKTTINYLKIRGSYGVSGSLSSDYYAPYNTYNIYGSYDGTTAVMPSYTNGLTKDNLTWAKISQKNIGIDLGLFNNRISVTADFYDKVTKNDFYDFNLPFFTGFSSVTFNAKDLWINNRGFEVMIQTKNLPARNAFQWNTNLNFSYYKNRIAKLPNGNRSFSVKDSYGVNRIYAVGQPIYSMMQLHYAGVYNHAGDIPFNELTGNRNTYYKGSHTISPGDPIFVDANNDGDSWDSNNNGDNYGDQRPSGDPNPKFTGGFINDFSYKNFYLSIVSVFTWKRTVVNTFAQQKFSNLVGDGINGFAKNRLPDLSDIDYWTPAKAADPNYKANFPSINPFVGYYYQYYPISDMFNVDGSYFKVKYVTLAYIFNSKMLERLKVHSIKVYGSVSNLLIIKNKNNTMPDPESVDQMGIYTGGLYPQAKQYQLGFTIQF
jgi:TonB-linked SusC/RagA family outer membrane protein